MIRKALGWALLPFVLVLVWADYVFAPWWRALVFAVCFVAGVEGLVLARALVWR